MTARTMTAYGAPPVVGRHYEDAEGRHLVVLIVDLADPLGRNVQGAIDYPGEFGQTDYACDLKTWEAVWRDKAPPTPREQMKVGG